MSSIGGRTFISLQMGDIAPKGMGVEEVSRPGTDGHAFAQTGQMSPETSAISIADFTDPFSLNAELALYMALKGTLATVVSDVGLSKSNVMVLDVQLARGHQRGSTAVGGRVAGDYLLTCRWRLQLP